MCFGKIALFGVGRDVFLAVIPNESLREISACKSNLSTMTEA